MSEPWFWLATVAEGAERTGDHHLLGSVAFFTFNWQRFITPLIGEKDEYDMRLLRGVPLEPRVRIFRAAARGLQEADLQHVLIRDPKGGTGRPYTLIQVVGNMAIDIRKELTDYPSDLQSFARDFGP